MNGAIGCLILPFLLPILIVAALFIVLIKRGKKQAYTGTIVEKIHNTTTDDDDKVSHLYSIKVNIDGKDEIHAIAVSKELFDTFKDGDRIEKKSGESWPHKID
jgi:hypothetical protein